VSGKRTGHYVVSTHWDREWYQSFQHYRFRLVRLMDELLDTMQNEPRFRYFQLDGQFIPVEDYLEIRPERESELRDMTEEGRLRLGPWYVLPDEFLVSGESIIRNLQMGITLASHYGRPSRVGFCCDMFGHISQLPQIFRGMGIDNAFVWRGVNESTHGGMFRWQAPDGSEVIAYRFSPRYGYCTWAYLVRECQKPDGYVSVEETTDKVRDLVNFETSRIPTSAFLLFDGGDHLEIDFNAPEVLERANASLEDAEIVFSHLDGFMEEVREQRDKISKVFKGELREPAEVGDEQWLIPGVTSSRVHLKQANARCETELCAWAEPFSTFASLYGMRYPKGYLDVAWKWLIQNHPHDSMCGCSIDQVHKDMVYRFDQAHGIASQLTKDATRYLADRVALPEIGEKDFALVVFNPSADAIDGPVDLTLRFPNNADSVFAEFFGFEQKLCFHLYDSDGNELPYQYVTHRRDVVGFRRTRAKFPTGDVRHEVDVAVELKVPAFGYTTIVCRPTRDRPVRFLGSMTVDDHTIENEKLVVSVAGNGTLTITDKRSKQSYENVLTLEDCADIGDGWYHGVTVNEQAFTSIASAAEVAVVENGINKATLLIRVTMNVPEAFLFDKMQRSGTLKPLVVTHYVTLRKGADAVEVRTVVENTIRDHRLRVLFPSGAKADTSLADQAFDVVERPIALRKDNALLKELEIESRPQQTWTAVFDKTRGLAVVSNGLLESAVRDLPARPIALTLLRSFIKAVLTNGNEGGEIQGRHEFAYRIVPLSGRPDVVKLTRLGQAHAAGLRTVQLDHRDVAQGPDPAVVPPARELPASHSFLSVSSPAVVTATQRHYPEKALIVRFFNPTEGKADVTLHADRLTHGVLTDLEGRPGDPAKSKDEEFQIPARGKQIVTVRLTGGPA
jgi:alpha-mannosidase/mannosylglycerate hydrolase